MCGIYASISAHGTIAPSQELKNLLCQRGPDHIGHRETSIYTEGTQSYSISLTSTVLALRGGTITTQPFWHTSCAGLCWNGEAWKVGSRPIEGNDGQVVFDALFKACSNHGPNEEATSAVLDVLRSISGPFAIVFLDVIHSQVYFARDRLGRRSLLYKTENGMMELSSVADSMGDDWMEVEADGVYQISFTNGASPGVSKESQNHILSTSMLPVIRHKWEDANSLETHIVQHVSLGHFNKSLPTEPNPLSLQSQSVVALRHQLDESLKHRVLRIPVPPCLNQYDQVRVAVLFSGGLDCTVLARMVHDILPKDQHVDLLNVAFENPRVVQAAKKAKPQKPRKSADDVQVDINLQDSTSDGCASAIESPYEGCPDRITGRKAFQELQSVCPSRFWRFVAINIPYTETVAHRAKVVGLIHPHNTEMDLSIAYALYFAARGSGLPSSNSSEDSPTYTTPARVLLSGLGADELFGGYTRHATAFNRTGYGGLIDELELDVNRLGKRNLGRDDRVIAHWGREARFPYLDEALVKWAVECPIWEKCGFQSSEIETSDPVDIEPGKKVLRLLAYELGMTSVAQEKKRAIQFGARTAKMEIGRTKGTALIS